MRRYNLAQSLAAYLEDSSTSPGGGIELSPELDAWWGAATLAARLLLVARQLVAPLDFEKSASGTLATEALQHHVLRQSAGELYLSGAARAVLSGRRQAGELAQYVPLLQQVQEHERLLCELLGGFWLSEESTRALVHAHAQVYQQTPSVEELVKLGLLKPHSVDSRPGFLLAFQHEHDSWSKLGPLIAARVWLELPQQDTFLEGTERLRRWLERVDILDSWSGAPRFLPPDEQTRFFDAAMEFLLAEPDLKGWDEENERLRLESPYGVDADEVLLKRPPSETPLQIHKEWLEAEQRARVASLNDRSRLSGLIGAIVRFDRAEGPYEERFSRIQKLLLSALDRPFLGGEVPDFISRSRPEAIAGLLTRAELASLGMSLLSTLSLSRFETSWDDWESRSNRLDSHRLLLWNLALQVVQETLSSAPEDVAARSLFEMLRGLSSQLEKPLFGLAPERERSHRKGLEERLDSTLSWMERPSARTPPPRGGASSLVALHGPRLAELFMESAQAGDSGWPLADLRILFWLLPRLDTAEASASTALVDFLVSCYHSRMFPEAPADDSPDMAERQFIFREPLEVERFAWEELLRQLWRQGRADAFLRPTDLAARLQRVRVTLERLGDSESEQLKRIQIQNSWAIRVRFHLRLLMQVYERLRATPGAPEKTRQFQTSLEEAIADLLGTAAEASLNLISALTAPPVPVGTPAPPLLEPLIQTINAFSAQARTKALGFLLKSENDLAVLLGLAVEAAPGYAREQVIQRIEALDIDAALSKVLWLPQLAHMLQQAMEAQLPMVAKRILAYGDRIAGSRPVWTEQAFPMRALIAAKEGGAPAVDALAIPDMKTESARSSLRDKPFEEERAFAKALSQLSSEPEKAAEAFDALWTRNPSIASAVNRFAARLHAAEQLPEEAARQERFSAALTEFEHATQGLSTEELALGAYPIAYNRLRALEGARRDEAFDTAAKALPQPVRFRPQVLELILGSLARRHLHAEAGALLDQARDYHSGPGGAVSTEFQGLEKRYHTRALTVPSVATVAPQVLEEERIQHLRVAFGDMLRSRPHALVRIIGEDIHTQLSNLLLQELLAVSKEFLTRAAMLSALNDEDKYNDVLVSLLRMRFAPWHWQVTDQSRGGVSGRAEANLGKGGVGERDWVIRGADGSELAVVEAFRLSYLKSSTIDLHVLKLHGYDAIGQDQAFEIIYCETDAFEDLWTKYFKHIQTVDYGAARLEKLDDLSDQVSGASIRLARAVHQRDGRLISVFHLFLKLTRST